MLNNDPQITELNLNAYVDGQLSETQRSEVEAHLSRHPEAAARVMRDLALYRDLRRPLLRRLCPAHCWAPRGGWC